MAVGGAICLVNSDNERGSSLLYWFTNCLLLGSLCHMILWVVPVW